MLLKLEGTEDIGQSVQTALEKHLQTALHCSHPRLWLAVEQFLLEDT